MFLTIVSHYKFARIILLSLVISLFSLEPAISQDVDPETTSNTTETIMIRVEESVSLATDIYYPDRIGPFPSILIRTPYDKKGGKSDGERFASMGYVVVIQDTRGKFASDGEFYPFKYERPDGLATINWIRSQSWSNGKIGGWGGSYVGYTQWAIADQLDAIVPILTSANMYELVYPSRIFSLATSFNWALPAVSKTINEIKPEKLTAAFSILPLSVADDSTYQQNDFIDDVLDHQFEDAYWGSLNHRSAEICPSYSMAGWYDIFLMGQIADFMDQSSRRHPDSRLIIGPYAHGTILIETDFGKHSDIYMNRVEIDSFLATHLKGEKNLSENSLNDKPYSLFIIHRNEWYNAKEWPPKNSIPTPFFLNPDGEITLQSDSKDVVAEYIYDPENPFPSLGGTFLGQGVGPAYQEENTDREDQLVFESGPLDEELVLLGPVDATIYVSTDAPSTDFFVSLQEVRSDGKIVNIQEGGKTIFTDTLSDERTQRVDISLWATGYQINPGHKIRVSITSSLFPRYNRNLNRGEAIFTAEKMRPAHQKVYLGKKYPSQITLPVLPME